MNKRRSSFDIVGDILRLGMAGKTEIMYSVNLTYAQLINYLELLSERGLVELYGEINRVPQYAPTSKGKELLTEIDTILDRLQIQPAVGASESPQKEMLVRTSRG